MFRLIQTSHQFPSTIWESLPAATTTSLGGIMLGSGATRFLREDGTWQTVAAGGSMVYPGAGIPVSTGTGWGTSITNNSTNWNLAYTHSQAAHQSIIAGTGFVKVSGSTLSYDNSTYSLSSHNHSGVYEPALGNPSITGYVLSSTTAGVRSWVAMTSGVTDHGALTGLGDDDHTQYYNQSRGDARYSLSGHTHSTYAPLTATINAQTSTYTVVAGDNNKIIECNGTFTVTLPNSLAAGFQVTIVNVGTGVITLAASTTLYSKSSNKKLASQWIGATAYNRGSNVWVAMGDLTA